MSEKSRTSRLFTRRAINKEEKAKAAEAAELKTARRLENHGLGEWIGILLAALVAALLIRQYVFQSFWIPSASMENTMHIGDRVLVNKVSYRVGDVHRGDIVVFKTPPAEADKNIKDLIKRVVAVPGDTIEARSGEVYINGEKLVEPYVKDNEPTLSLPPTKIGPNLYFVMGDNRTNSSDSRVFGPINKDLIVGKTSFRVWPLSRLETF